MRALEIPTRLPVDHLSASSIGMFIRCPEQWRRRYIERDYGAPSAAMVLGSAIHAAEGEADHLQIETGERPASAIVQDAFADEWEDRSTREEVEWEGNTPGALKDAGVALVAEYDRAVGPQLQPVTVEREFRLDIPNVEWDFMGFIDMEEANGAVVDRKVIGRSKAQADADSDLQPAAYLLARRAEGDPAPAFRYHCLVKTKKPKAEVVTTTRTDAQLDAFTQRLYGIASEMAWRVEHDQWALAVPGSWWCSAKSCSFWTTCPGGGAH